MISGTTVTVLRPTVTGTDRFNAPTYGTPTEETVVNVLIGLPTTADLEAGRPFGITVEYTLHFPKTYTASLEGCEVVLPAKYGSDPYAVVGDPRPLMDENTPTPWNRPVMVGRAHG